MNDIKKFAIVGCQRCGTTLMGRILGSSNEVSYYDEDGNYPVAVYRKENYLRNKPNVGFKLTSLTAEAGKFAQNDPQMRFVFLTRHILPVCASMIKLGWVRPELIGEEFQITINNLYPSTYKNFLKEKFLNYNYDHLVYKMAALYIQSSFNLLYEYDARQLDFIEVNYERLIANPVSTVKRICQFLRISFNEKMLNPTPSHKKINIHGTTSDRAIDNKSINKFKSILNKQQISEIMDIAIETQLLGIQYYSEFDTYKGSNTAAEAINDLAADPQKLNLELIANSDNLFQMASSTRALTEREKKIAFLFNAGKTYAQIAAELNTNIDSAKMEVAVLHLKNKRLATFYDQTNSLIQTLQRAHLIA